MHALQNLAPKGIKVTCINPAAVATPMTFDRCAVLPPAGHMRLSGRHICSVMALLHAYWVT